MIRWFYRLRTAHSIAGELSRCRRLDDALKILVDRVAFRLKVEIVSIMFMDNDKRRLVIKIAKGLHEEIIKGAGTNVGEGVAGWVGRTGEALLVRDITKDTRFMQRSVSSRYYNNSLLSVPLKVHDRIIGVINVNNKRSRGVFREWDLDLLITIADSVAIVIENIKLREDLKKMYDSNYELVSNVSHEMKTPLAVIKEAVALMLEGHGGAINEKQKKYLELSSQNVERLNRCINEYMESAVAAQGKSTLRRSLFDITETVKSIVNSLNMLAIDKNITLKEAVPDKKIQIWGDPDKLNEVISNLVDNAIKYTKQQGKIDVVLNDDDSSVIISVSDTGMGIPREEVGKIFDRFYRAERPFKEGIHGTGLGLSIVKNIVDMHRGNVMVESEPDKGSKFTVVLPKNLRR